MTQAAQRLAHRRTETQQSGAFTFWFRRPYTARHIGAWMLDRDADEAAFITTAGDAPSVGEQLELSEPYLANPRDGQQHREPIAQLPKFGRVVRLDDPQGDTRRVAIRFEQQTQPVRV
jgi:hypothetical protein